MPVTVQNIRDELGAVFAGACGHLAEARLRQQQKDTPEIRAAVAVFLSQIDAVLDLYLEIDRHVR